MATAHYLPGRRGEPVSKHRSRSAPPYGIDQARLREIATRRIDPQVLKDVKEKARSAWTDHSERRARTPTSYAADFHIKSLDEPTPMRPPEPQRRNKPHPPEVFLTTRLRSVPGYHDPDAAVDKPTYKIDASRSKKEQELRAILRRKYQPRPATTSMMQFDRRRALQDTLDPHAAQATEAWLKLANDKDKRAVLGVINDMANRRLIEKEAETAFRPEAVPSLHRWLKKAGRSEAEAMTRLMKTLSTRPTALPTEGPHFHITDYSKVAEVYGCNPRPYRREFVLHPEWKWEYIQKHGDIKRTVPHLQHIEAQTTPYNRGPQIFTPSLCGL
ncbi:PREDICTED: uncharacterized protein LOC109487277 [Branchiostoma belcheri]|uniref:Uncharacterized protein LOC109487277 n=1 Tax=Branchiostoma belcheri TaxID=7741 RepID=A0A6P5AB31_BRABE|nr:PREDICTED: uncharacterized protein LOC109487277 [Branchiostoma belcheri]